MKEKNINEMPFEYRIRMKYLLFGIMLGLTGLSALLFVSGVIAYVIRVFFISIEIETNYNSWVLNNIVLFGIPLMFIPLLYIMWNSKQKPKKYPNNEEIGLKWDWEKVKRL